MMKEATSIKTLISPLWVCVCYVCVCVHGDEWCNQHGRTCTGRRLGRTAKSPPWRSCPRHRPSRCRQSEHDPVSLAVDNQSAIAVSYNPEHHSRMKHVARRHFFIRECVENMQIEVPFVHSDANLADFFTKPLDPKRFFGLRNIIMNHKSP